LLPPNQLEMVFVVFSAFCKECQCLSHALSEIQHRTYVANGLVERIHRLVQLSASLLDGLVDVLLCFLPVLLKLLVDLVSLVAGFGSKSVDLLASVGGKHLGVFADLSALAGNVVLCDVLGFSCVG
jgi:hypothetical protein